MTYPEAARYLDSFINYEKNPPQNIRFLNLDRIKKLASIFGNPQDRFDSVHITGTKGKGSTAFMVSSVLKEAGFRVGLYTSPHLIDLTERIKINNIDIGKNEFASLVGEFKNRIRKIKTDIKPSFFEVMTMLAFNYFKKKRVDIGIFEVGMGGRFDATNILRPIVTAITSISYDHTKQLGKTLCSIAAEKSGIIKSGVSCISAPQRKIAMEKIRDKCAKEKAGLFIAGKDITYKSVAHSKKFETLNVRGLLDEYKELKLPLLGEHQLINAAVSIGIIETLRLKGYNIGKSAIIRGMNRARWPGRCEIIHENPVCVLDSAHNKASARALKNTIKRNFNPSRNSPLGREPRPLGRRGSTYKRVILVLGILRDKDIKGICGELEPLADKIVLTKIENARSSEPAYLRRFFEKSRTVLTSDISEAYKISKDLARRNDIILLTGSVYLAGEFKKLWRVLTTQSRRSQRL